MLTRRTLRGWEKLNDWVTLLIDKKSRMNVSIVTRHFGKRQKLKEKPRIVHKQIMDKHKQWWTITIIGDFISRTLTIDPRPMSRKLVMAKAISNVKVCDDLLYYILLAKATILVGLIFFFSLTCMLKNC
jgi:hypothetical protein